MAGFKAGLLHHFASRNGVILFIKDSEIEAGATTKVLEFGITSSANLACAACLR